ncbi:glycosyltransferase family 2 protein [Loktanella sp. DJP18]|uniref:glycosyltransferase family 2 protein n=1 Tax=Loktanella sp. DJP18 TaxID=3409788 RepID=UPI003BB6DD00
MSAKSANLVSFVIPVYNEEAVLPVFFERMDALLGEFGADVEVILVNDGSVDASLDLLRGKSQTDPRYITRDLSRNFGHQIAITAGIDAARGDAVIIMDADLQDPPEIALEMIAVWRQGAQVVSARRRRREGETFFKRATAKLYYQLLSRLSPVKMLEDVGDFRLIDRQVVDALRSMKEHNRYLRGMISWVGYKHAEVLYDRHERAAGASKYTLNSMALLASNGVIAFSEVPLRIALWFGLCVSMASFAAVIWVLLGVILGGEMVSGWASTMIMLSLLSGVQLLTIGVVGLYVGRIYNEVKGRPLYFVNAEMDVAIQPAVEFLTAPTARQT